MNDSMWIGALIAFFSMTALVSVYNIGYDHAGADIVEHCDTYKHFKVRDELYACRRAGHGRD